MNKLKKLPTGISSFREIIEQNYLYIDKTDLIYEILDNYKYVFLSRPRRFGKSLLVSTMTALFEGKKELFKNLDIENKWDFNTKYPVITITQKDATDIDMLDANLLQTLDNNRINLGIENINTKYPHLYLEELIKKTYEKYNREIVILIDEYDKPVLSCIDDLNLLKTIKEKLKNFYSIIKDNDQYIKFGFLTGVTKFTKMSVFSGLNNIEDITFTPKFATVCGYTQDEIEGVLKPYLDGVDLKQLKIWYNGYNFDGITTGNVNKTLVYNPFGIFLFLKNEKVFDNYWSSTGTPSFLVKLIQENNYYLPNFENIEVNKKIMESFNIEDIDIETIMLQAGYLTIKETRQTPMGFLYKLGFPNKEVKTTFTDSVVSFFTKQKVETQSYLLNIFMEAKLEQLEARISSLFNSIAYNNFTNNYIENYEGFYASVLYAYFSSLGFELIPEDVTNKGRIDLTLKYQNFVYIFEFKVDSDESPLEQIKARKYYQKYDKNEVYIIGINFDTKKRELKSFKWEKI